jgi:hypothetical protein
VDGGDRRPCYDLKAVNLQTENGQQAASFRASFARVAQFRPFGDGELEVAFVRRQLIIASFVESGGSIDSIDECQEACQTLWHLELDREEIESEVLRLVRLGQLKRNPSRGYRLSNNLEIDYAERIRGSEVTEEQAISEWLISVKAMGPELSDSDLEDLKADLVDWIQRLIAQHGMEAALVLYPEQAQERADEFINRVESAGCGDLPSRSQGVEAIREKALYLFIRNPTSHQRSYLANLMTTAYLMAVFTIDPEAHEVLRELTADQVVYLDTNVVYDLLNLSGPKKFMNIKRTLDLTRKLGYKVRVTPWTVAEMKHSVRKARSDLSRTALPPKALSDLAAEASGDDGFVTAYWRKYKETGVKAEDFFDLHDQIEALLEEAGVEIYNEGCIAVGKDANGMADRVGLLTAVPGGSDKPYPVLEHDAKHRLLIERLRGDGNRRFSNAGYWFLTEDSVLMPFSRMGREESDELPFAVSLSSWAHIVRSLSPRTEDYEQSLVDLLDSPAVRPKGVITSATIAEVLGRVDLLVKDSTEEIATRMLLDRAVLGEVERRTGPNRLQFVDGAIEEKGRELRRELQEVKEAVEAERQARETSEKEVVAQAERLRRERQRRMESDERVKEAESAREAEAAEKAILIARHEQELDTAKKRHNEKQQTASDAMGDLRNQLDDQAALIQRHESVLKWSVTIGCFIIAVAIALVPGLLGWATDGWPLALTIAAALGVGFLGLRWHLGRKKAAVAVGIVLAIISLVSALRSFTGGSGGASSNTSGRSK